MEEIYQFTLEHIVAITIINIALFVGFIVIVAVAFSALPTDYWQERKHLKHQSLNFKIGRNILALPIFLMGVLMLFLPGQGLLTILLALLVSDFSYKRNLINKIISKQKVRDSLDSMRLKLGKKSFDWPTIKNSDN